MFDSAWLQLSTRAEVADNTSERSLLRRIEETRPSHVRFQLRKRNKRDPPEKSVRLVTGHVHLRRIKECFNLIAYQHRKVWIIVFRCDCVLLDSNFLKK